MPIPYWEGTPEEWNLVGRVQHLKRSYSGVTGRDAIRSDQYVIRNPVTGQAVPRADLAYAAKHIRQLYESGQIREDRWAFLWYH
jgi:hypothetical protein